MISAIKAKMIKGSMSDNSLRYNLRQINKMIKSASAMGLDKIILTWINTDIMNELYDKGYRIYKTKASIQDGESYSEKLVLYVVQWSHADK